MLYTLFKTSKKTALVAVAVLGLGATEVDAQLAKCKGKYMGNIIANSTNINYNAYWNQATSENGSKWGSVEGTQGSFNWSTSDIAYNWAKNNGGLFKYHNFAWGSQTPGWVANASVATITNEVKNYIAACSSHYTPMGGLKMIDVVNEPVNTALSTNYKAALTAGYQAEPANAADKNNTYGWVIWVYQLARKAFPNATLLINEYNVEHNWNNCRQPYIDIVNAVKNAPNLTDGSKNLIDGVGLQCHGVDGLSAAAFKACIDEIWTKTGVSVHLTEFDAASSPNEAAQQTIFSTLVPVAWEHPHVAGITFWGYVQGTTWINGNGTSGANGTDSGIIYANGNPRPAFTWLQTTYMASQPSLSCCPAPAPFASCTSTCTAPAAPTVTSPIAYCIGAATTALTATGTSLLWYTVATNGTGTATAPTPSTTTATTTNYYVSQTSGTCESPRATIVVTINPKPVVTITSPANNAIITDPTSIPINASVTGTGISNVQFYNGTTSLGIDPSTPYTINFTNAANGSYTLYAKVTNTNNCTDTAMVKITVNKTITGLEGDESQSSEMIYFPNPFTDNLTLESNGQFTYQLYDLTGNKLAEGEAINHITVGQTLSQGVYLLKISHNGNNFVRKITKN